MGGDLTFGSRFVAALAPAWKGLTVPYTKPWSSGNPGCLILLVDQSQSMEDPFGAAANGTVRRCDEVANAINTMLDDYLRACAAGAAFKERAEFAIIGYGGREVNSILAGPLQGRSFVGVAELAEHPARKEVRTIKGIDIDGNPYETKSSSRIWIEPRATGRTPMCAAVRLATSLARAWAAAHQSSYPPVVVNITDGKVTDSTPQALADDVQELKAVGTTDGLALLFNCHISGNTGTPVEFAQSERDVPALQEARDLFWLSSPVPETARKAFFQSTGKHLADGTRAYIFNGDAASVRKMLTFGTTAADGPDVR